MPAIDSREPQRMAYHHTAIIISPDGIRFENRNKQQLELAYCVNTGDTLRDVVVSVHLPGTIGFVVHNNTTQRIFLNDNAMVFVHSFDYISVSADVLILYNENGIPMESINDTIANAPIDADLKNKMNNMVVDGLFC
jgi:hypothetical protein